MDLGAESVESLQGAITERSPDEKRRGFIVHDQRIVDEFCNLACDYCEGFSPSPFSFRPDEEGKLTNMPESWRWMVSDSPELRVLIPEEPRVQDFFSLGRTVVGEVAKRADSRILKLSGGEVTLFDGLLEYVRSIHADYTAVQILTNGYKLTHEDIDAYSEMGNIYFQVSLDGTNKDTNYARTHNPLITEKVVDNVRYIAQRNVPIEINCVLTKHNTGSFEEMLIAFEDIPDMVIIPRPVRGEPKEAMDFTPEQLAEFRATVLGKYDQYKHLLPPRVYLERLIEMMEQGSRSDRCYVPFFVMGVNNYGDAETCSCGGGMPSLGNVLSEPDVVFHRQENYTGYSPDTAYDDCEYCMTQYELMNLYIEGLVSAEDMRRIPTYRYDGVIEQIESTRAALLQREILTPPPRGS